MLHKLSEAVPAAGMVDAGQGPCCGRGGEVVGPLARAMGRVAVEGEGRAEGDAGVEFGAVGSGQAQPSGPCLLRS